MNFFRSRFFVICLVVAILLALVPTLIAAFGGTDMLRSVMGTVAKPFTMCGSGVANAFNGFIDVFTQYDELKAENEELICRFLSENPEFSLVPFTVGSLEAPEGMLQLYPDTHGTDGFFIALLEKKAN